MKKQIIKKVNARISLRMIDLKAADDRELKEISSVMGLALSLDEMKALKGHFSTMPTDVELQTFGQTWSEHCIHKTFKGDISTEKGTIKNIFKNFIAKATKEMNKPWCFSVFEDNAGLVDFDKGYVIAAKVETHNHPSAVEPFGGAATGTGGVIRDILGVWGEPIACSDVLCFGPLDTDYKDLIGGVKHPKYIYKGVIAGIGAYGNNMGLPTVNGAILFDKSYTGNVVVYCGCYGMLPKDLYINKTQEGDLAVLAGGKTGRDGIHGVTFASADLSEEADEQRSAVQIPNPLVEERLRRATLRLRDSRLCTGITDLGGGGISCATGEMAYRSGLGLGVNLSVVHLKEKDLAPWEIWVSESQERMLYSISPDRLEDAMEIFKEEEVEACILGRFNKTGKLTVIIQNVIVCDLDLNFLYSPPTVMRFASLVETQIKKCDLPEPNNLEDELLTLLADPNIRSREGVIRTYDHEVRACTAIKPLQGSESGPNDAAVLKPLKDSWMGIVISCGINPFLQDPYWMAASSIDEAVRNNVAVGGRRIAILDNFVWGNPEHKDRMSSLLRAVQACYDFAVALDVPFISGKDSLYNESPLGPVRPTLLITGIGMIPDIRRAITAELRREGNPIFLLGTTKEELSGSAYLRSKSAEGGDCPTVDGVLSKSTMDALTLAIDKGLVASCHDLSDGGLGIAASEMVISSKVGMHIDLTKVHSQTRRSDFVLFSESNSRFLVEVEEKGAKEFAGIFKGLPACIIGETTKENALSFEDLKGKNYGVNATQLRLTWRGY
ncbi:MAG: phosphoribosylformylglycinamidine synthase subunit PurL [Candidatus Methanomethylicus sp.]|nr:phosphoribosylformylglycinamidine synthase subunit PurL [Candidatus Methanomethylicus sp.]